MRMAPVWPASSMPPWTAVSRITHDYMDIGGRVTHGAITEEQLSKLSALTHMDVGNAVNAGAFLLPTNTLSFAW
jgi:hypothetical protein